MIGGYQILDLRGIDLQISASASNITDPYVLKQLLSLRDHIDKAYNFNKPLVNQLKPVLIRFRDKKNGEKTEGATFGEMSVVGNYYTFKITGRISGQFTLIINVAFHEVTNAYGNKEWLINTAKIQLADASDVLEGDIAIDGDLTVSGSINGEANPSVKPIYCHPINIITDIGEDKSMAISLFIFDNDPTPYTWARFLNWLDSIIALTGVVRVVTTGSIIINNVRYPANYIYGDSAYRNIFVDDSVQVEVTKEVFATFNPSVFNDGVNKIN